MCHLSIMLTEEKGTWKGKIEGSGRWRQLTANFGQLQKQFASILFYRFEHLTPRQEHGMAPWGTQT